MCEERGDETCAWRWPGGFCCLSLPADARASDPWWDDAPELPPGPLRLGAGHLQRIRSPFDQAPGDLSRFRRQAKSRTYHQPAP